MASNDTSAAAAAAATAPLLEDFVAFLNEAWTCYHATAEARRRLLEAGFKELDESKPKHDVKVRLSCHTDGRKRHAGGVCVGKGRKEL